MSFSKFFIGNVGSSDNWSRKNCHPLVLVFISLIFLYSCNKNIPATKTASGKSEMIEQSEDKKDINPQLSSESEEKGDVKNDDSDSEEERDIAAVAAAEHANLFVENDYPSATTCATCHPKHYKEWSVSQHSYAQLSPVYLSFSSFTNEFTNGTNGDFCFRCHTPIGANLNEDPFMSNLDRHPASREGITCIACHRITKAYNKRSGRLAIQKGDLLAPVYGPKGGEELKRVLDNTDKYRVVTEKGKPGRKIHTQAVKFEPISSSTFCGQCHDVTLLNGFRLEEAFSEYRMSPAAEKGITCQDCHMGKVQGIPSGYEEGPAAIVGGKETAPRKLTNHIFAGPDYSVIHPGIFPHNVEAQEMATMREWLQFDYKAGWGTDEFEDKVAEDMKFPARWESIDDRYDAREILNVQFERLEWVRQKRLEVLKNGYKLADAVITRNDKDGLAFKVKVENLTDGHNVPTGFAAERLVFLQVTVTDKTGKEVFKSGDLDPNGDVRDHESSYVINGDLPLDDQLFDLRGRILVTSSRGGERERVLPVPYPVTTTPFIRPTTRSRVLTGETPATRINRRSLSPLDHKWAEYKVDGDLMTGEGPYKAKIDLIAGMAPANLIGAIKSRGFDYNMSAREVADNVGAGYEVLESKNIVFDFKEGDLIETSFLNSLISIFE
ncbi:MAG: cytochrome C [Nitrospinae bacterium]|nr:cytochrome C [Nitrospinota bacterium]